MKNKAALDTAFWTYCKATGLNPDSHPAIEEAIRQAIESYEIAKLAQQPDELPDQRMINDLIDFWHTKDFGKPLAEAAEDFLIKAGKLPTKEELPTDDSFPMGAIENGRAFIGRLISNYRFEDSNRKLETNAEWDGLCQCFEYMAEYLLRLPKRESGEGTEWLRVKINKCKLHGPLNFNTQCEECHMLSKIEGDKP